jgi:hypothetical protein
MKKKNTENIKELLAMFVSDEEARRVEEDIAAGDRIFDSNPAPKPSAAMLADIKTQMAAASLHEHRHWRHRLVWEFASAAAIVVLAVWAGMALFRTSANNGRFAPLSESFWIDSSENSIESRISQIERPDADSSLMTLEGTASPESSAVADVTDELNELNGTFWEG